MKPRDPPGPLVWLLGALVALGVLLQRKPAPRLPAGVDAEDIRMGYERSDMQPTVVLAGAAALLVILACVLVLVTTFKAVATGIPPTISRPADLIGGLAAAPQPTPPAPALEAEPGQTLDRYMAGEQQKLNSYRWVDRSAGIAAIPIDRAIDLLASSGLPARETSSARDTGGRSPSTASSGRVEESYP
jgi:hypothetical protein